MFEDLSFETAFEQTVCGALFIAPQAVRL